jgi:hypothetical protein
MRFNAEREPKTRKNTRGRGSARRPDQRHRVDRRWRGPARHRSSFHASPLSCMSVACQTPSGSLALAECRGHGHVLSKKGVCLTAVELAVVVQVERAEQTLQRLRVLSRRRGRPPLPAASARREMILCDEKERGRSQQEKVNRCSNLGPPSHVSKRTRRVCGTDLDLGDRD